MRTLIGFACTLTFGGGLMIVMVYLLFGGLPNCPTGSVRTTFAAPGSPTYCYTLHGRKHKLVMDDDTP